MLLWLDLETTGLTPSTDRILEVAWTITHDDLREHLVGIRSHVITPSIAAWDLIEADQFIQGMHGPTGLLDDLTQPGTLELSDAEDSILSDINAAVPDDEPLYLAGASVHFDLAFIRVWMPRLADKLSHRVYDTSMLKAFFHDFIAIPDELANKGQHRAANDVEEVLAVARHFRTQMEFAGDIIEELTANGQITRAPEAARVAASRAEGEAL